MRISTLVGKNQSLHMFICHLVLLIFKGLSNFFVLYCNEDLSASYHGSDLNSKFTCVNEWTKYLIVYSQFALYCCILKTPPAAKIQYTYSLHSGD